MTGHSEERSTTGRPLAVWTALIILACYLALTIYIAFIWSPDGSVLDTPDEIDLAIDLVEAIAIIGSLVVSLWALATRRLWGRWFAAMPVAYIIGTLLWEHFFFPDVSWDDKISTLIGTSVGLSPLVIAVLLVSFGEKVKDYFAESPVRKRSEAQPPP